MAVDNDATIILNRGVGGDTMDATVVTDPTGTVTADIKRERVVLSGDQLREAIVQVFQQPGGVYGLNVSNQDIVDVLTSIDMKLGELVDLLRFG